MLERSSLPGDEECTDFSLARKTLPGAELADGHSSSSSVCKRAIRDGRQCGILFMDQFILPISVVARQAQNPSSPIPSTTVLRKSS